MSLIRRKPYRTRKISYFAEKFGLSAKTIKRYAAREGWQIVKYGDSRTSPGHLHEATVEDFFAKRQERAFS